MCTDRKKMRMMTIKICKHRNTIKHRSKVRRIKHRNTVHMHRRNRDLRPPAYQKTRRSQTCMIQRMARKQCNIKATVEAGC
jgi:hypothetical protein